MFLLLIRIFVSILWEYEDLNLARKFSTLLSLNLIASCLMVGQHHSRDIVIIRIFVSTAKIKEIFITSK